MAKFFNVYLGDRRIYTRPCHPYRLKIINNKQRGESNRSRPGRYSNGSSPYTLQSLISTTPSLT